MSKTKKRGRDTFYKIRWLLIALSNFYKLFPKKHRAYLLNKSSKIHGKFGLAIRYAIFKSIAKKCGNNVAIFQYCTFLHPERITVGDNVSIQPYCYIDGDGNLSIGSNVSIAHAVSILTSSHIFEATTIPIRDQGLTLKEVTIEDDVWIGAKATILSGITIKKGTVVGCNAVLNKSFPGFSVVAGVPAHIIRRRY